MAATRSWPPLIVGVQRPSWVRIRDILLTCIAWLALAILLNRELDLGLTVYLDAMGMESYTDELRSAGLVSRDQAPLGWSYFGFALSSSGSLCHHKVEDAQRLRVHALMNVPSGVRCPLRSLISS